MGCRTVRQTGQAEGRQTMANDSASVRRRIVASDAAGYASLARALREARQCPRCTRLRERGIALACGTYGTECRGDAMNALRDAPHTCDAGDSACKACAYEEACVAAWAGEW